MQRIAVFCLIMLITMTIIAGCATETTSPVQPRAQAARTETAPPPAATHTRSAPEMTLIAEATQTGIAQMTNPASIVAPTLVQAQMIPECTPGQFTTFDSITSQRIQTALMDANIKDTFVSVIRTENSADCTAIDLLELVFSVNIEVVDVSNSATLGNVAADVLGVLAGFDADLTPGARAVTLNLSYSERESDAVLDVTNIPYAQAQSAAAAGLRGDAMLNRLRELGNA